MKRSWQRSLFMMGMLTCRVCCGQEAMSPSAPSPEVAKKLQKLLDGFVSQPHVVNYVALVDGGSSRWRWAAAAGIANPQTNEKMTVLASVPHCQRHQDLDGSCHPSAHGGGPSLAGHNACHPIERRSFPAAMR